MNTQFWRFFSTILDIMAPPRGTEARVRAITLEDLQYFARSESALPYKEKAVTALVWELKYRANSRAAELAGAFLSEELVAVAAEELGKPLLIPVPMHAMRRRERGYNQTELLCEATLKYFFDGTLSQEVCSRAAGKVRSGPLGQVLPFSNDSLAPFEYVPDVLLRTRATPPQQGLPKHERLKNIKNAMEVTAPEKVRGRVCIVVDDVTTTGATFEECTRVLKAAGARAVHCVALARS